LAQRFVEENDPTDIAFDPFGRAASTPFCFATIAFATDLSLSLFIRNPLFFLFCFFTHNVPHNRLAMERSGIASPS
jgi:hypothetical protein